MKRVYIGLDCGSTICAAAAKNSKGRLLSSVEFPTSEHNLIEMVKKVKEEVHVMLEESEMSGWVYRVLRPHAKRVVVSDPKRNAWIAKSSVKNDKVDAEKLAELLRLNSYTPVYQSEGTEEDAFKKAVKMEIEMGKKVAELKMQIKSQLRREGVIIKGRALFNGNGFEEVADRLGNGVARELLRQNFHLLEHLEEAKMSARALVSSLSRNYPVIQSFLKVPGVGPILASRFVAYVQTPYRFSNPRKLWKYSRLGVTDRTSDGKALGRERLDPNGNGVLKDVSRKVFEGAMRRRGLNLFSRTYLRAKEKTGNGVHARLITQRKILSVLRAMWRDETEYDDSRDEHRA